jgi:hypothetical protein
MASSLRLTGSRWVPAEQSLHSKICEPARAIIIIGFRHRNGTAPVSNHHSQHGAESQHEAMKTAIMMAFVRGRSFGMPVLS